MAADERSLRNRARAACNGWSKAVVAFAGIAINDVPGFIVAQLIGAAIGALVSSVLFRPNTALAGEVLAKKDSAIRLIRPGVAAAHGVRGTRFNAS